MCYGSIEICGSVGPKSFSRLKHCAVIEGNLLIHSLYEKGAVEGEIQGCKEQDDGEGAQGDEEDYDVPSVDINKVSFPLLLEITEFLLVARVHNLR